MKIHVGSPFAECGAGSYGSGSTQNTVLHGLFRKLMAIEDVLSHLCQRCVKKVKEVDCDDEAPWEILS